MSVQTFCCFAGWCDKIQGLWHRHPLELPPDAALLEDGCLPGPGNTVVIEPGQVTILLYLAEVMVQLTWHQILDPDNHCIPYLTQLGDLLGRSSDLLTLCFLISWLMSTWIGEEQE
ncbi:solute carrier family 41 member 2-like [Lontra canadensis]|uniref:solute carrier family 41 member 2-like n=1 Tax=Lontra canadensis TaxID=76717 RepID=UPI0013F2E31B|nr:solute carrier family 41 member 2-like [Lontra canadensis]